MDFGDRFLVAGEAFRFLLTLRPQERRRLDDLFQSLAENPFLPGDFQEHDEDSRPMEVLLRNKFLRDLLGGSRRQGGPHRPG